MRKMWRNILIVWKLERKKNEENIAASEQSSHTPGRSHQKYVETIFIEASF